MLPVPPVFSETPPEGPPTQNWGTRTSGVAAARPAEPEPERRRLLPWIALGVVVVAAVAAGAVLLLGGGDDGDPDERSDTTSTERGEVPEGDDGQTPEGAVASYFTALDDQDCETLIERVSEETWSEGGSLTQEDALAACEENQADATRYTLEDVELTGGGGAGDDTATVDVTVSAEGETTTVPVELVRQAELWVLDLTQS